MACSRVFLNLGSSRLAFQIRLLNPRVVGAKIPVASLTSVNHLERDLEPRKKPFPYEKIRYNTFTKYLDLFYGVANTRDRMVENSKLIVVEGTLATGKNEFAKKLAQEFDMKYFPDVGIDETFISDTGFDLKKVDVALPTEMRAFDNEMFHTTTDPEMKLKMGETHMKLYAARFNRYCNALLHLLCTGQGVVLTRSCLSDRVFTNPLYKFGYMTREVRRYMDQVLDGAEEFLWRPHLVIYLDAPVDYVLEKIKKRDRPYEAKSKVWTKEYLEEVERQYVNYYLKGAEDKSNVVSYDVTEGLDYQTILEDLELLNYEPKRVYDDHKNLFTDWHDEHQEDVKYEKYRLQLADGKTAINAFASFVDGWRYMDNHEMGLSGEMQRELELIEQRNPEMTYVKKYRGAIERKKKAVDEVYSA